MRFEERNILENKEILTDSRKFEKEIIAFLNYKEGGVIYIGVDKNGKIVGVEDPDGIQLKIKNRIRDNILPYALEFIDIILEQEEGKYFIKIAVQSGSRKPYYLTAEGRTPKGCFIRVGSGIESMDEDMIERIFEVSYAPKRLPLSKIPALNDSFSFETLKSILRLNKTHINEKTFLKNFNLVLENGKFNKLAELLADENRIGIAVCVFKGQDKVDYLKRNEYGYVSLLLSYKRVIDYCETLNDTYVDVSARPRKELKLFDNEAFEEAWINAVVHNRWDKGEPGVYWYQNRMEIVSQGGVPDDLTQDEFLEGITAPVNPDLMEIFKSCSIVEKSGHGVPKIVKIYGKNAFKFTPNRITVTIPFNKLVSSEYINSVSKNTYKKKFSKNINSAEKISELQKTLLKLIEENPNITLEELASRTSRVKSTVYRNLKEMKSKNIIDRLGSSRKGHWILKQNTKIQ